MTLHRLIARATSLACFSMDNYLLTDGLFQPGHFYNLGSRHSCYIIKVPTVCSLLQPKVLMMMVVHNNNNNNNNKLISWNHVLYPPTPRKQQNNNPQTMPVWAWACNAAIYQLVCHLGKLILVLTNYGQDPVWLAGSNPSMFCYAYAYQQFMGLSYHKSVHFRCPTIFQGDFLSQIFTFCYGRFFSLVTKTPPDLHFLEESMAPYRALQTRTIFPPRFNTL